jgi:hypothetical protein
MQLCPVTTSCFEWQLVRNPEKKKRRYKLLDFLTENTLSCYSTFFRCHHHPGWYEAPMDVTLGPKTLFDTALMIVANNYSKCIGRKRHYVPKHLLEGIDQKRDEVLGRDAVVYFSPDKHDSISRKIKILWFNPGRQLSAVFS